MTEVIENSRAGSDVNQTFKVLCSGKPYIYLNGDTQIIYCNDAFTGLTGLKESDLIGFDPGKHIQNKQFTDAARTALKEGIGSFRGKVQLGVNITDFYFDAVFLSVGFNEGREKGSICFIIESKTDSSFSDAKDVAISDGLLKSITGIQNTSISVHDLEGKILYISPSTETLLGYKEAELKELPNLFTVHPDDKHLVLESMERIKSGQKNLVSKYRLVHKNGSVINVESTSYLVSGPNNEDQFVINVTLDLSSQAFIARALAISEQKYYRLVMNLPSGVSLISNKGKLLEANDALKKIMGMPLDSEMPELNFFQHDTMKQAGISDQLKICIQTKEIVSGERQYKSKRSGSDVFLIYSFIPILNHDGNVETIIGYVSDLSQQKIVESESRERADFLNLVINAIKSPFFVKNEEHKWVILNDAAVEMMGSSREALLGKSDYDLYPEEQADVFWKYDEMVFKEGSSINEEVITWADGTLHTIVTNKQLYIEKPTGKKFIVGTIHDISGYKKIEEELRASEMKYRELFDNANDFIVTLDLDGNITNANRTLLKHLKLEIETLTALNINDFIPGENKEYANELRTKLLSGELESSFEVNALGIDGQPVTYEVKASLIKRGKKTEGVQCVFSDITEQKEARLKLEKYNMNLVELNKTKDKFFSIIAHDLRNPYSSMIGFSELLLEDLDTLSKDEIRDSLKIIRNSAKNSLNLLENLLAWSRLETGRMPFDPVKTVLTDIVDEVVNVLFSLAYRKKIEINNMVEHSVLLSADKNMLNTILNNLVMNAIKFTPIGGEINIYAVPYPAEPGDEKEFLKISVADTGIGMESDVRDTLFSSPKPVSSPGTEKEQGTGLGLVLSREMVERHGGKIMVESTPGKGSVFSFLIPVYN